MVATSPNTIGRVRAYDTRQLFNSMDALKPIIVAMIDDTADQQT